MPLYRKKPVVISSFQFQAQPIEEYPDWFVTAMEDGNADLYDDYAAIYTLEGKMIANIGDYIIQGVKGELYPCKEDIFLQTYEPTAVAATMATFGYDEAHRHIFEGKQVARRGWNGAGQFVFLVKGSDLQFLTQPGEPQGALATLGQLHFGDVLALKNAQDVVQLGWSPSQGDMSGTDWYLV